MIGTLKSIVLDCPDPKALAAFYAELVGGTPDEEDETWVDLDQEHGPRLSFQLSPDHKAPTWPAADRPQQFHLDISVELSEVETAEKRVLDLGATLLEGDQDGTRNWRVYADPAGHPFCLCYC